MANETITPTKYGILRCGIGLKYAQWYDDSVRLEDRPSADALDAWIETLPETIERGTWLLLLGGVGCGKTMAMVRIAARLWEHAPDLVVRYEMASELQQDLLAWDRAYESIPVEIEAAMRADVLMIDDLDRWLLRSPHDIERGQVLYRWDVLAEYRDSPGKATVVAANQPVQRLQQEPAFVRWLDRARRGIILEIPGMSRRRQP